MKSLTSHLPDGRLHIPSVYSPKKVKGSFPVISEPYDAIILSRRCKNKPFHIKKKKLSSSHAYLILRKRKSARVLYLPYCCVEKGHYVAPLQYYMGAILAAIIFVIILHFLSKSLFREDEKQIQK